MKKSLFLLFVGLMMLSPVRVFAIIAEGTSGTCKWVIDDEGALVVSPISGDKGTLSGGWSYYWPVEWFKYAKSIKKVLFSGKISAKTCYGMFFGCNNVTEIDLSNLDTENVTDMSLMFEDCSSLSSLDLSSFKTENVTDMIQMFMGCSSLSSLDLSSFNTGNVTNMSAMFQGCSSLSSLDLSSFKTGNVTYMRWMFLDCSSLSSLDLSSFKTGNVTDMTLMFGGCSSLSSLDLSSFNTGNVTSMSSMFYGCSSLSSLDLSSFNTGNVTGMSGMFYGCSSLSSLDLSSFNTGNVTSMSNMFYGCSSLSSLDLSSFNTGNVTYMSYMFHGCSSLSSLDLTNFTVNQTCRYFYIFYNVGATIISNCKTPSSLPDDFFNSYYPAKPYCLVVPAGSENEYSNASGWRNILTRVMTDENPMVPQMDYNKYMLGYERKVSGNYATFCLPFDLNISNWRKETGYLNEVYVVSSVGGKMDKTTGLIKLQVSTKINVLSAGTPFIVKLAEGQDKITFFSNYAGCDFRNGFPKAKNVSVSIPNVEVSVSGTLFDKLTNLDKTKYRAFNTEGNFGPCDWVNTFRAYVYKNDTNSHAKADNIVLEFEDGTTTSIDEIDGMEIIDDNAPVYNLIGQRVNGQAKGLMIKNGKKVMVK